VGGERGEPDDVAGDGESALAVALRRGDRADAEQFREARDAADASGVAGLAGGGVRPIRVVGEGGAPDDHAVGGLPAGIEGGGGDDEGRSGQPALRADEPAAAGRGGDSRFDAGGNGGVESGERGAGREGSEFPAADALSDDGAVGSDGVSDAVRCGGSDGDRGSTDRFDGGAAGAVFDESSVHAGAGEAVGGGGGVSGGE